MKANLHRFIPLSQGIDKIMRTIQIVSIKLNPTQNGGQLKVDQLSNFDGLPFRTEVTYTPVSVTVGHPFTMAFVKRCPSKMVKITNTRVHPKTGSQPYVEN